MMTDHERWVASLGCAICGREAQCHHLLRVPGRHMMGKRAPEQFCIPLCPQCHGLLHDMGDETVFMATHKLNGEWLAGALWGLSGSEDDSGMLAIALARYGK